MVACPTKVKNGTVDSGKINNYTTNASGDAHSQGVCLVLNSTFTAGGLATPIFVVCYGLTLNEMPYNDMVTLPIPGLTVGSDRNIYSSKEGYITFVRGNYGNHDDDNEEDITDDNEYVPTYSKEAKIAKLYRDTVYHPFIHNNWDPTTEIPDDLRAVSWMDRAQGQIKLITDEENLKKEDELKITCDKHSAARTGVEQAADLAPTFKLVKKNLKRIEVSHQNLNPIVLFLQNALSKLEDESNNNRDVVRLATHKKKAKMFALSNLPGVTPDAFTVSNVCHGFIYNGQLDAETTSVPSFKNLINTRGDMDTTVLSKRSELMDKYFEEMYLTGTLQSKSKPLICIMFQKILILKEILFTDQMIFHWRTNTDQILSSSEQISSRRRLIDSKCLQDYNSKLKLYDTEHKDYVNNVKCEQKFVSIIQKSLQTDAQDHTQQEIEYKSVQDHLTVTLLETNTFQESQKRKRKKHMAAQ